jgi:cystathionine beta-synthase
VKLHRVAPKGRTLWLKLESANPGGSSKDRAVRSMVLAAEREGSLKPGATLVEGTAGNTGIGLAVVAAARGYRAVVVMPRNSSEDKQRVLRALGAEIVHTPPDLPLDHPESYVAVARRLVEERPGAVRLAQFENLANPDAHRVGTGPEIWSDCGGRVDVLIGCVGTGGTLSGTSAFLAQHNPKLRLVVAFPEREPSTIEGIADDDPPEVFGSHPPERRIGIADAVALGHARRAAREEGLLIGLSSGAALAAALDDAPSWPEGSVGVVIAPDTGRNYLAQLAAP